MSRAVSITVPRFSDDDSDASSDDSRPAAARYDDADGGDDDDQSTSSESSESSELAIPQPRVRVDFDDSDSDDDVDLDSDASSVQVPPNLHATNTDTPAHTWRASEDAGADAACDGTGLEGPEVGLTDEEDDDEEEDYDDRNRDLGIPDPLGDGALQDFFTDEDSRLWRPQQLGVDPTKASFLSSMPQRAQDSVGDTQGHDFPGAFWGSWTVSDEFVGLGATAARPAQDQQHSPPQSASAAAAGTTFVFSAQRLRAAAPQDFLSAAHLRQVLDLDPTTDFGRAEPRRLRALEHLARAVRPDGGGGGDGAGRLRHQESFASCFSLLHTFLTAWNEAEEECEAVNSAAATALGCIDPHVHRLQRLQLHVREWLRDELAGGGDAAAGASEAAALQHQILRRLVKGQWEEAQRLASDNGWEALGAVLASSLWSVQAPALPLERPAIVDSQDWFARWTTGLSEALCSSAADLVGSDQLPVPDTGARGQAGGAVVAGSADADAGADEAAIGYVFRLVTGRLQELFPFLWQGSGRPGAAGETGAAADPCRSATAAVEDLIRADWKHALAMSLFYGRKDRPDLPAPPRNGASANGEVDLFLTRIIREYTEDVVGQRGAGVVFPETFREYAAGATGGEGVVPKAPLPHWPPASKAMAAATARSASAAAAAFVGSRFQCREWHVLNVLRCALEILQLQDQEAATARDGDGRTRDGGGGRRGAGSRVGRGVTAPEVDETVEYMFFHAFSALAIGLSPPPAARRQQQSEPENHQLVWYLAIVLDKTLKTVQATLHQTAARAQPIPCSTPRALPTLLASWRRLISHIAATNVQERAAHAAAAVENLADRDLLNAWARGRTA